MTQAKKNDEGKRNWFLCPRSVFVEMGPLEAHLWDAYYGRCLLERRFIDDQRTEYYATSYEDLLSVWEYGAEKYGDQNWKVGDMSVRRLLRAAMRHATSGGKDPESGLLHDHHMFANLYMALDIQSRAVPGVDDTQNAVLPTTERYKRLSEVIASLSKGKDDEEGPEVH